MEIPKGMGDRFKVENSGTLFEVNYGDALKGMCPLCFKPLKEMYLRPLLYCTNKNHKRFIMKKK